MNELPPDSTRLRAILSHLDHQLADTETVTTYLRLQRQAVQRALAAAERQTIRRPSAPKRRTPTADAKPSNPPSTGFVVERRDRGDAPKGAVIHTSSCSWSPRDARPVEVAFARDALAKDQHFFAACSFCRPDNALGFFE
ncbi:hypothetical protein KMT30_09110 [Streptomyces sp. IBSBF 2953]|nr:hypothetical protein [Streptomyces hayashii]